MVNYLKAGTKVYSQILKPAVQKNAVTKSIKPNNIVAGDSRLKLLSKEQANVGNINNVTKLGERQSFKLYNYLPKEAQENFSDLLSAGKRLGYIKTDTEGRILGQSMERFLTVLDKEAYSKMIFLEQNFKNLDKSAFKKLLNAYKTSEKMATNKANIEKWLKVKDELYNYSKIIEQEGLATAEKEAKEIFDVIGIQPEVRGKGLESIYDKLSRKVLNGKEIDSLGTARKQIGDLVGTRLVLDDISDANIQKIVDNICKGIESGKIKITEIHNYLNASKPYFSQAQFEQIRTSAARRGYEIPRLESEQKSLSGYVSAQMNVIHSLGTCGELQIRGKLMNKYGEIEHIPYDIRRGKNIGKNIPELEEFFKPVEDAVTKLKRNGLDKVYDDYILNCYKYLRKYETDKIKGAFKLPQFPKKLRGYEILKFESLDKIHVKVAEIKTLAQQVANAA